MRYNPILQPEDIGAARYQPIPRIYTPRGRLGIPSPPVGRTLNEHRMLRERILNKPGDKRAWLENDLFF